MRVKFILPSLTEARGKHWRPIKYSLFPPLGLATLAGYLDESDEAEIVDEHVEPLRLDDEPDLVAIETYVTSAYRAYRIADEYRKRGVRVVMGGLHATACPEEAAEHADTVVLGPAEEAWPRFLADFRRGRAAAVYRSSRRDLDSLPPLRRDLIKRRNYHNRVVEYEHAVKMLHERGVMINGSFIFGVDGDDASVFSATTEWAIARGIETATFHILTPYPGTDLFRRYSEAGRIRHRNWDLYDTRHAVFDHPAMSSEALERGYGSAYETFYKWSSIVRSGLQKDTIGDAVRHIAYVSAWKKFDPLWSFIIHLRKLSFAIPALEAVLGWGNGDRSCARTTAPGFEAAGLARGGRLPGADGSGDICGETEVSNT